MIDPDDLNQKVEQVNALLKAKLGLRGGTLAVRLNKAGRSLPKRVRIAGQVLVNAQEKSRHPKLARLVDRAPVLSAAEEMTRYLSGIDRTEQRKTAVIRWLSGQVFNLLLIAAVIILLLRWRGLI